MKKSNSLNNIKDIYKDDLKFKSMKNALHFPTKQIKSNILLNCFIKDNYLKLYKQPKKSEYNLILNQKKKELNNINKISASHSFMNYNKKLKENQKTLRDKIKNFLFNQNNSNFGGVQNRYTMDISDNDSYTTSYNNNCYNSKLGMNAPHSFIESPNNCSDIEHTVNLGKNVYNNDNEKPENKNLINDYINNSIKQNYNKNKILYNINNNKFRKKNNIIENKSSKINSYVNEYNKMTNLYNNYNAFSKIKLYNNNNYFDKKNYNNDKYYTQNNSYSRNYINSRKKNNTINSKSFNNNKRYDKNIIINKNKNDIFNNILLSLENDKNKKKNNNMKNKKNISSDIININNGKNFNIKKEEKKNINIIIKNTEESLLSSDDINSDFNNINSPTLSRKIKSINNSYNHTKKFITNKNNHFKINQKNESSLLINKNEEEKENKYNKTTNNNISKSPLNSLTTPTKDKTNRTLNKQQNNNIINIKQDFLTHQNMNNAKINKRNQNSIYNKKNKAIDNGNNYKKERNIFIEKNNPGIIIYKKDLLFKEQKEKKLEDMRKKIIENEISEMRPAPKINDYSKQLTKNNIPIYKRLNEIENKRKKNTQKIIELIIKENEITENTINDKCAKNNFNENNFNKWILLNENWELKKNLKIEKLKNIINQEKMESENFKFKPKINRNSERIFYTNYKYSQYPVEERLAKSKEHKKASIKKIEEEELLSFKPDVNKDYQIRNQYYEFMGEDQVEIYNLLKEKINST